MAFPFALTDRRPLDITGAQGKAVFDPLSGAAIPSWVLRVDGVAADFDYDLTTGNIFGDTITNFCSCVRASQARAQDSNGDWPVFSNNVFRRTRLGGWAEISRTNSLRNNTATGAVAKADFSEKLTNGGFTGTSGAGWSSGLSGGTGSVDFSVTGQVTLTGDNTNFAYVEQQLTGLTIGRNYVISFKSSNTVNIKVGTSQGDSSQLNSNFLGGAGGTFKTFFTATQTSHWIRYGRQQVSGIILTNLSVQDGERIYNGNFALDPINAAQNTAQNAWLWGIGGGTSTVTWNGVDGVLLSPDGTNQSRIEQPIPTLAGQTYTLSLDVTGTSAVLSIGASQGSAGLLAIGNTGTGTGLKYQFTATGSTSWIRISRVLAGVATIKNVSIVSAGSFPTSYAVSLNNNGLILAVTDVGSESQLPYFEVDVSGTASSTATSALINAENATQIAATWGQTWGASLFGYVSAGSIANLTTVAFGIISNNSGGSGLQTNATAYPATSAPLGSARMSMVKTLDNSATAFVNFALLRVTANSGTVVAFRMKIGMPQLENNTDLLGTIANATIASAGSGGTDGAAVFSLVGGTGTVAQLNVTITGGVISAINSIATIGAYNTMPSNPVSLSRVSGAGVGLTGATVNITPTDKTFNGYATSPIDCVNAATARSADSLTMGGIAASTIQGAAGAVYMETGPTPAIASSPLILSQSGSALYWGRANNATALRSRVSATDLLAALGGSTSFSANNVKSIATWDGAGRSLVANNGTVSSDALSLGGATSVLLLPSGTYCGPLRRLAAFKTRRSDAGIKSASA